MQLVIVEKNKESQLLKNNFEKYLDDKSQGIVISLTDIKEINVENTDALYVLHSLQRRKEIIRMANELSRYIDRTKIYVASIEFMHGNLEATNIYDFLVPIDELDYMDTILIPICEHCNLNCKGCSHFSPLVKEKKFLSFDSYCRDLERVKTMISHTNRINFLGGEPLLHDELEKFIYYARELYPYAELNLVTNGILLKQISDTLKESIIKTNTIILLSLYPPFESKLEETKGWLEKEGITYKVLPMTGFAPMLQSTYEEFPEKSNEIICSNNVMLQDGMLARCPMYMTVGYYNESFGESYPYQDGILDIYEDGLNAEKIHAFLYEPHELCHYCARYKMPNAGMRDWSCYKSGESAKKEDWLPTINEMANSV